MKGFFTRQPLTLPYYYRPRMQGWVDKVVETHRIDSVLAFSSAMAQYVDFQRYQKKIIDFVDVDSDKWLQYSKGKSWPASWIYRREAQMLGKFDREMAGQFDCNFFVSDKEADLFKRLAPEISDRITYIDNGVDTEYFSPEQDLIDPYSEGEMPLVFTGAMDYWANVDAVTWFATEVFPRIYKQLSSARFYIVGAKPADVVRKLNGIDGVRVTGVVEDVRPFIRYSGISVAPLRIARGVQNKVLEAMAMGRPVLATKAAMEGIRTSSDLDVSVTDDAQTMAEKALVILNGNGLNRSSDKNRRWVMDHYSWENNTEKLGLILAHGKSTRP